MSEIWKTIKGFEDYKVSSLGRVKSFKCKKEIIKKESLGKNGYLKVSLYYKGKEKTRNIHQLVAEVFLNHKPCGYKLVIDHINDIKTDNRVENLQIVSSRFNVCKIKGNYSSQYSGVCWDKSREKWHSRIYLNGNRKHLGHFTNEQEASQAYQTELLKLTQRTELQR